MEYNSLYLQGSRLGCHGIDLTGVSAAVYSDPALLFKHFYERLKAWEFYRIRSGAIVCFGDSLQRRANGDSFEKFIIDHKLGQIVSTPAVQNYAHNETDICKMWVWVIDFEAITALHKDITSPKARVKKIVKKCLGMSSV